MHKTLSRLGNLMALTMLIVLSGCAKEPAESNSSNPVVLDIPDLPPETVDLHDHPTEGPHHGELIELGGEEYHAELLHPHHDDDEQLVAIYILDGSATEMVAIDAGEVTLNMKHDGKGKQFKLKAAPGPEDSRGTSSRFSSQEKDLLALFQEASIVGRLVVSINGKSYTGDLTHAHGPGHDHGHDH